MHTDIIKENLIQIWKDLEKTQWISCSGSSMKPLITDRTELLLQFCKPDKIHLGHIIAFRNENEMIVHRILGFSKKANKLYFIEKGDNNPLPNLIPQESLIGRIVALKKGSRILSLRNPLWRILDFLYVIFNASFIIFFKIFYKIKILAFGKEKKAWTQNIYLLLKSFFLFIPENISRLIKRFSK
ncbi:MAG: signal peptidase I [Chlamydiae bacterium]|nr:signal peptidase I [Chlamydiota bacterium]MBI3265749.1 signal peptidase I [Chlamydiota bacterium]